MSDISASLEPSEIALSLELTPGAKIPMATFTQAMQSWYDLLKAIAAHEHVTDLEWGVQRITLDDASLRVVLRACAARPKGRARKAGR